MSAKSPENLESDEPPPATLAGVVNKQTFPEYKPESIAIRYAPVPLFRKKIELLGKLIVLGLITSMIFVGTAHSLFPTWLIWDCWGFFLVMAVTAFLIALGAISAASSSVADRSGFISANEQVIKVPFYGGVILCPWQDLETANLAGRHSELIILKFRCENWPVRARHLSDLWGKYKNGRQEIVIDLNAISERSRQNFLLLLRKHMPAERLSNKLKVLLQKKKETESFTELWMSSIKQGTERVHIKQLAEGTFVNDHRYEIIRIAGAGGQGIAYEAIDHLADTQSGAPSRVILKEFILPVHADEETTRKALLALEHEEALLKQLASEHIVALHESFVDDFRAYLVVELIEGKSLRQIVESDGAFAAAEMIPIAIQMCKILSHLHSFNPPVIHRDFTPDNLILSKNGILKLIDFDVARHEDNRHLNQVVGKPSYIAPEQFRGQSIPASDIYSAGASIYFLLTGKEPTPVKAELPF